MRKSKIFAIAAISLVILVIISFKFLVPRFKNSSNSSNESSANAGPKETVKAAPVAAEAVPAHRGDLVIRISASGKTEALHPFAKYFFHLSPSTCC